MTTIIIENDRAAQGQTNKTLYNKDSSLE
jgi:hypothetical protein